MQLTTDVNPYGRKNAFIPPNCFIVPTPRRQSNFYVGRNTLPCEIGRIEPNRHTISDSHNFHPTQTRRFPLCTGLPRDLDKRIILKK